LVYFNKSYSTNRHGGFLDYPVKGKGSPYSITDRRVPELIPVLGSQPAGDVVDKYIIFSSFGLF